MKLVTYLLVYGYAAVMGISGILLGKAQEIPLWLMIANVSAAILLSCTSFSENFLYVGIMFLFICALINDYELNGRIRWTHVMIRLSFSVLLIYLYHKNMNE